VANVDRVKIYVGIAIIASLIAVALLTISMLMNWV